MLVMRSIRAARAQSRGEAVSDKSEMAHRVEREKLRFFPNEIEKTPPSFYLQCGCLLYRLLRPWQRRRR